MEARIASIVFDETEVQTKASKQVPIEIKMDDLELIHKERIEETSIIWRQL